MSDQGTIQFVVIHSSDVDYIFQARDQFGNLHAPRQTETLQSSDQSTTKVYFSGLDVRGSYSLTLFDSFTGAIMKKHEFKVLDPIGALQVIE